MSIPLPPVESRSLPIPMLVGIATSVALALLSACSNGSRPRPGEEKLGIDDILTPEITETFHAYQADDCDRVLERTVGIQLDPHGSEAHAGEVLLRAFCLDRSGDVAAARDLYDQLSTEAPLSYAALDARERLRILDLIARDPEYAAWVRAAPDRVASIDSGRPPVDRVQAAFPPIPFALGLEGYAVVEFGILPDGQTDAVIVVDAEPPLLFEGTALRAVREWRYAKDPKAAEAQRQVVRIVFRPPGKPGSDPQTGNAPGPDEN